MKNAKINIVMTAVAILSIVLAAMALSGCNLAMNTPSTGEPEGNALDVSMDIASGTNLGTGGDGSKALTSGLTVIAKAFNATTRAQVGVDRTLTWDAVSSKYKGTVNVGAETGSVIVHLYAVNGSNQIVGQGSQTITVSTFTGTISITSSPNYALKDTGPAGGWIVVANADYSGGYKYVEVASTGGVTDAATVGVWIMPAGQQTVTCAGATGTALGSGLANTNAIQTQASGAGAANSTYVAGIYFDKSMNGFSDWYLPSSLEMNAVFTQWGNNGAGCPLLLKKNVNYMTSTQSAATTYTTYKSNNGTISSATNTTKGTAAYARAVRRF